MIRFLLYGNFYVAFAAYLLTIQTGWLYNLDHSYSVTAPFVFFATLFIYNFQRLVSLNGKKKQLNSKYEWISDHSSLLKVIIFFSMFFTIAFAFKLHQNTLILLLPLLIISVLYAVPFFYSKKKYQSLRTFPLIKIFLIALVWTGATAILPYLQAENISAFKEIDFYLSASSRFLFIFSITIPFDIKDIRMDKQISLKTLPIILGVKKAKVLAFAGIMGFCALIVLNFILGKEIDGYECAGLLLSAIVTAFMLFLTHEKRHEWFFDVLIEGLMIIQVGLVWIFNYFSY